MDNDNAIQIFSVGKTEVNVTELIEKRDVLLAYSLVNPDKQLIASVGIGTRNSPNDYIVKKNGRVVHNSRNIKLATDKFNSI